VVVRRRLVVRTRTVRVVIRVVRTFRTVVLRCMVVFRVVVRRVRCWREVVDIVTVVGPATVVVRRVGVRRVRLPLVVVAAVVVVGEEGPSSEVTTNTLPLLNGLPAEITGTPLTLPAATTSRSLLIENSSVARVENSVEVGTTPTTMCRASVA
jgi:hypothetical protein